MPQQPVDEHRGWSAVGLTVNDDELVGPADVPTGED
jgi:hypothetical protein